MTGKLHSYNLHSLCQISISKRQRYLTVKKILVSLIMYNCSVSFTAENKLVVVVVLCLTTPIFTRSVYYCHYAGDG